MDSFTEIQGYDQDEEEPADFHKRVKFNIVSDAPLPFCYQSCGDGAFVADDCSEISIAEEEGFIKITQRDILYNDDLFTGEPEPILYGGKSYIEPIKGKRSVIGEDLGIGKFGDWKCQRCGEITNIPPVNGTLIEPFECGNEDCHRKGTFIALFPKNLIKPIWKLPGLPIAACTWEIYTDIYNYIKEYIIMQEGEYHIMTLWIMASWLVDDFSTAPYLLFLAPKESGKSQALDALALLSYRATKSISVTTASLFRSIEQWHITLLIDESENQLNTHTETGQALYGCLNGGYKRGSYAMRTEGDAGNRMPQNYDVFGFKGIGTTKITHPTLESRSIVINMTKGIPQKILFDETRAFIIRSKLLYWRFKTLQKLPLIIPKSTSGRITEMFIPLATVAGALQGLDGVKMPIHYNELELILKNKIKELESYRQAEEQTSEEARIIEAIREIIESKGKNEANTDFIYSKELAIKLQWIGEYDTDNKEAGKAYKKLSASLKAMGIEITHRKHGNGIEWLRDDVNKRIEEMTRRYFSEGGK